MTPTEKLYWEQRMTALEDWVFFWEKIIYLEERIYRLSARIPDTDAKSMAETCESLKAQIMRGVE